MVTKRDKERIRDALERELACLRALDVPPEKFAAARHARSVRRRNPDPGACEAFVPVPAVA